MGVTSLMGPYGGYKSDISDWSGSVKEFSLRLVCPTENIRGVIGKGGSIINQIRQESRASIKVDSSGAEGDDCILSISAKELFEDLAPTIDAAMRLQSWCSQKVEKELGDSVITTRLLVPQLISRKALAAVPLYLVACCSASVAAHSLFLHHTAFSSPAAACFSSKDPFSAASVLSFRYCLSAGAYICMGIIVIIRCWPNFLGALLVADDTYYPSTDDILAANGRPIVNIPMTISIHQILCNKTWRTCY
ncbi:hypothetical protein F0562_011273 [Nyssa sinensis]|uniref:K Homology domain-containing protein n=1 Tax=Nyssa sinensis TaxID=561372 RepID=A0A5J5A333_9ASTE|nr:hypothetical protein F0562_011273 [Nyssa sinensis]